MKISIASDHAGVRLKKIIIDRFKEIDFDDEGPYTEESCDYPDFISKTAQKVQDGVVGLGIVICGSGIGASITANKFNGIRAALCFNSYMADVTRKHNDSNILALGARIIGEDVAIHIVETWLGSSFEGGRHQRRIDKITDIEKIQK